MNFPPNVVKDRIICSPIEAVWSPKDIEGSFYLQCYHAAERCDFLFFFCSEIAMNPSMNPETMSRKVFRVVQYTCATANDTHNRGKKVFRVSLAMEHTVPYYSLLL